MFAADEAINRACRPIAPGTVGSGIARNPEEPRGESITLAAIASKAGERAFEGQRGQIGGIFIGLRPAAAST